MNRISEKVKDIVDVRVSANLNDFLIDPAATLDGYHFTDITADLMAKWLDQVAVSKQGGGNALALAGFRGVGKSHFLAVLGAIISQPELRPRISDAHVMSKSQRLSRRHGLVAYVRRGSDNSLLTEVKNAIAETFGTGTGELSDSITDLLQTASDKGGDLPLVLLIDTASGRSTRVSRDDGAFLSEIAAAARASGVFLGIALDDDIAGADGINSSIASSFAIDYLDQEHLYKIVNAYVFAKRDQMRPLLREIYNSYRETLPGFRWSEHRFLSLYPLHPAILEIAPFIRLYLHDFALLGFASDAGVKILGRPANSLIGLDEVFDSIETKLRAVSELDEAFTVYDLMDRSVIAKLPVMKRHEAKLVLKGLFLLSFNDEVITARELSAAMLIFDESGNADKPSDVEELLRGFNAALPEAIRLSEEPGLEAKYGFNLGGEDSLKSALTEAIEAIPAEVADSILLRQTAEKFSDFEGHDNMVPGRVDCQVVWRGGIRRGTILSPAAAAEHAIGETGPYDWKVLIRSGGAEDVSPNDQHSVDVFEWRLGTLTAEDNDAIRRYHVLQTDAGFRDKFRDALPTVIHIHSIAVEKIWQRVFLKDSRLISDQGEYRFTEEAISSHTLSQLFTVMLAGYFEEKYPLHPEYLKVLGTGEVSLLTEHLFSGSGINKPDIQKLAADFAVPLGLAREIDGSFLPLSAEDLAANQLLKDLFADTDLDNSELVPITGLSAQMQKAPYGLTEEGQHLVLVALVAQRRFEFVTSSGNRINHRSLDLQIVWDDIVGIARPSSEAYSMGRLLDWAVLFTGDATLKTLKSSEARLKLIDKLGAWLDDWRKLNVLIDFDQLPDEKLNSKIWRIASNVRKTFGVAEDAVQALLQNTITTDECLQTIADIFCDSEDEFQNKYQDLLLLIEIIGSGPEGDRFSSYLTFCEPTNDAEVEELRAYLTGRLMADSDRSLLNDPEFRQKWEEFKSRYSRQYAEAHDEVMVSNNGQAKLDEFLKTDIWSTFAELSAIPLFGRANMENALTLIREIRQIECSADVRSILEERPSCLCHFSLVRHRDVNYLMGGLGAIVTGALSAFPQKLLAHRQAISNSFYETGNRSSDIADAVTLAAFLDGGDHFPKLSGPEIQFLRSATAGLGSRDDEFAGQLPFETLSDIMLENELGRLQNLADAHT